MGLVTYVPPPGVAWSHFCHGNVPRHQLDWILRPSPLPPPLRTNHVNRLLAVIQSRDVAVQDVQLSFANLSFEDTRLVLGQPCLGIVAHTRIAGALDHAGRPNPRFVHAVCAGERLFSAKALTVAAQALLGRTPGEVDGERSVDGWYLRYLAADERGEDAVEEVLRSYILTTPGLPELDKPVPVDEWVVDGMLPGRLEILHDPEFPMAARIAWMASLTAQLCQSKLPWQSVTDGPVDVGPGGDGLAVCLRDESRVPERAPEGVVRRAWSSLGEDPERLLPELFGARRRLAGRGPASTRPEHVAPPPPPLPPPSPVPPPPTVPTPARVPAPSRVEEPTDEVAVVTDFLEEDPSAPVVPVVSPLAPQPEVHRKDAHIASPPELTGVLETQDTPSPGRAPPDVVPVATPVSAPALREIAPLVQPVVLPVPRPQAPEDPDEQVEPEPVQTSRSSVTEDRPSRLIPLGLVGFLLVILCATTLYWSKRDLISLFQPEEAPKPTIPAAAPAPQPPKPASPVTVALEPSADVHTTEPVTGKRDSKAQSQTPAKTETETDPRPTKAKNGYFCAVLQGGGTLKLSKAGKPISVEHCAVNRLVAGEYQVLYKSCPTKNEEAPGENCSAVDAEPMGTVIVEEGTLAKWKCNTKTNNCSEISASVALVGQLGKRCLPCPD